MIAQLHIENYALIEVLHIRFDKGFSVITGETGAGKSIILGALSLVQGNRADTGVIKSGTRKCIVEALFQIKEYGLNDFFVENDIDYDDETYIRREININGKSRAFINDTPVNLNILRELTDKMIDIHSQFQTRSLDDKDFQLSVIDNVAGISRQIRIFKEDLREYHSLKRKLEALQKKEIETNRQKDYHQFLLEELTGANLNPEEQEDLENELQILNHAEEIKSGLFQAGELLLEGENTVLDQLRNLYSNLEKLIDYYPDLKDLTDRFDSSLIEMEDIARELQRMEDRIQFDPDRLQLLANRLDFIYGLQQKHHVSTVRDLIEIKNGLEKEIENADSLVQDIEKITRELQEREAKLWQMAEKISEERRKTTSYFEKEIMKRAADLGLSASKFKVILERSDQFLENGIDKVTYLFQANRGGDMREISEVASGGERSRLMLVIKSLISQKNLLPTLIMDEIDIGVSGEIAGKMGTLFSEMSKQMQVIVITHLPQIAAKGKHHYLVFKTENKKETKTNIELLNEEGRIEEIAKMLSDQKITDAALKTSRELLGLASI